MVAYLYVAVCAGKNGSLSALCYTQLPLSCLYHYYNTTGIEQRLILNYSPAVEFILQRNRGPHITYQVILLLNVVSWLAQLAARLTE